MNRTSIILAGAPALGMGTAYLLGGFNTPQSIRMVHLALDHGVRYFDTAPLYGLGTAEAVLARALRGVPRDSVRIATKVGIPRPDMPAWKVLMRSGLAPLRARFPRLARSTSPDGMGDEPVARLDVPFVKASVEQSLRALRIDRIDLLLLHEARPADITDELIAYLQDARERGLLERIGVGSTRAHAETIRDKWPDLFDVAQFGWNVFDRDEATSTAAVTITHRSIMGALPRISTMAEDRAWRDTYSTIVGMDLGDRDVLARILVAAAMASNRTGPTLVASRSLDRMSSNLTVLGDPAYRQAGVKLRSALVESMAISQ